MLLLLQVYPERRTESTLLSANVLEEERPVRISMIVGRSQAVKREY